MPFPIPQLRALKVVGLLLWVSTPALAIVVATEEPSLNEMAPANDPGWVTLTEACRLLGSERFYLRMLDVEFLPQPVGPVLGIVEPPEQVRLLLARQQRHFIQLRQVGRDVSRCGHAPRNEAPRSDQGANSRESSPKRPAPRNRESARVKLKRSTVSWS